MSENEVTGTAYLSIKSSGIEWFDKIVNEDEGIKDALRQIDLRALDKRLDELKEIHKIKK